MDELQKSVKYYRENLQRKEINICAGRKNEAIDLHVDFGLEQFKHLAGLHKLEDMPYIAKEKSRRLFERIENGEITSNAISRSEYCSQVLERLECIRHIKSIITEAKYIYKSPKKSFYNIDADYMLSKTDESLINIHLFLKEDRKGHVVPVSILSCATDKFNNFPCSRWTILSKDKIEQQSVIRQDENTKEKTNDEQIIVSIANLSKIDKEARNNVTNGMELQSADHTQQVRQVEQAEQVQPARQVEQVGQSGQTKKPNNKKGRGK